MLDNSDDLDDGMRQDRAHTAAHLYYVQNKTMGAIARELVTSRSTVSRLLSYARGRGIVDIQIRSPYEAPHSLESRLAKRYGITAHVVPVSNDVAEAERHARVARGAAHVIHELVHSEMTVGIAWGSTLAAVSTHLISKPVHDTTFVQLNGSGNGHSTGILYASEILSRFGDAYNGSVQQFPVPAFFDNPQTKRLLWQERSTQRILEIQKKMSLVVFSVGSATARVRSHVYSGGFLNPADFEALVADRVVGDVATVFYRADGSSDGIALNERATGPSFDALRSIPRRCCVVAGVSKLASLRGAIAADLVTDLVIDEETARVLAEDPEPDRERALD